MITSALFGSGVSYVSEIPGVHAITDKILIGEGVGRQADGNYYINGGQTYLAGNVQDNLKLINFIKEDINAFYKFFKSEHLTNYEDIYYVLRQIRDSYVFEFENPAVFSLVRRLVEWDGLYEKDLKRATMEAIKYIECIVWQMISWRKFTFDQFGIIPEWIGGLGLRNIFSLNHDLVLDKYLIETGLLFNDGFEMTTFKFPQWVALKDEAEKLNLLKLHGSVDWFEVGVEKDSIRSNEIFKLPNNFYLERIHDMDESMSILTDGTPKLLIGTFNKMLGYLSDIFEAMYDEFKKKLNETEVLIVSGYGFADKGINTQLSRWLNHDTAKKMVIIHPYMAELKKNARGSFHMNILTPYGGKHPKVEFIEKKFEKASLEDIIKVLD